MRPLTARCYLTLALLLIGILPATAADPLPDMLATIDGGEARALAQELAGVEYRGRMTGEPELYQAASRITDLWREWGITPVGDTSFQQPYTVLSSRVTGIAHCTLQVPDAAAITFSDIEDFHPFPYGGSTPVTGDVVFAGYGIHAPDLGYDDYADIDVTNKIVFAMRHCPQHDMTRFDAHAPFVKKAQTAREQGAIGLVLVTDPNGHDAFAPLDFPNASINLGEGFAAIFLHTRHAQTWFEPSGQLLTAIQATIDETATPMSFPLGVQATLEVPTTFQPEQPTVNVVGYLEGQDPLLKREILVIGAHLDHLGYRGDRIYPGADDNGSGTVALLSVARAFATAAVRPARSLLFVHFSGEEMGLLGSEHFVKSPLIPAGSRMVAMLNMDMVGLGNGGITTLVPPEGGSDRLRGLVELQRGRYLASELPVDKLGYGVAQNNSDHAPFAKSGIPALFFVSSGDHPDYHQPGDIPDKLDASILQRAARLCTAVAWQIAQEGVPTRALAWEVTDHRVYHAHADES